jgi:hypothetical protein
LISRRLADRLLSTGNDMPPLLALDASVKRGWNTLDEEQSPRVCPFSERMTVNPEVVAPVWLSVDDRWIALRTSR